MDEKMQSILDDVRKTAADAGARARELLSAGKANIRLAELNAARLTALRIKEAKRMIRGGKHTFSQIAEAVGFESIHYFSKLSVTKL